MLKQAYCLNCENTLQSDDQFCSHCGQDTYVHPITFAHFIHDATHFFTHADKGIFFLIRKLAHQPGIVAREYLSGKRKKYMSPLSFFLLMVGLFVFTLTTFNTFEQPEAYAEMRQAAEETKDPIARERRLKKTERAIQANRFMTKNSNFISLLLATPLVSLIFFLFYRKSGYNYTEHLAVNFYFGGFSALFFIFIIAPMVNLVNQPGFYLTAIGLFLLLEMLYRSFAYYQFMNKKGMMNYLKALTTSAIGIIIWSIVSSTFIYLYIQYGFHLF
jgi:hypothetical protein